MLILEPRQEIATDQTGRFPVTSSQGNQYLLILYDFDSNAILAEPMTNRSENEQLRAFNKLHTYLTERGFTPKLLWLDNEASAAFKSNLRTKNIDYQLVPPHSHRRLAAERAIQTFKNHFITILSGTDKDFPLHLWDRLIPQATTTLNLLRSSRLHPHLSANTHPCARTPGLWKHTSQPICFSLVVDNFGIKYVGEAPADMLRKTFQG
jgi:hypothetical protein